MRRFPLENVSAISLSKQLFAFYCSVLQCSLHDKPIAFIAVVHVRMRARYYRVSRLVVLPDYQGIGIGKRLLNFAAEFYTSQTKLPFYILTSNPQIIHGGMKNWKITRFGHASQGTEHTRINNELKSSLSRKRITVSLQYIPMKSC